MRVDGITPGVLERWGAPLMQVLEGFSTTRGSSRPARARRGSRAATATVDAPAPTREQSALYGRLKALRSELAREAQLPAYCIFGNQTLVEMARRKPLTDAELLQVPGVGAAKLQRYGAAFLKALRASD